MTDISTIEAKIGNFIFQVPVRTALTHLKSVLPEGAIIYLVGGAIRNLIIESFHGYRPLIEDIDIFIGNGAGGILLAELLPAGRCFKTDLGGIRWKPAGSIYSVDICLLRDFTIIKKYGLKPDLDNLLGALDFTMNTVVFDTGRGKLYERNALTDIRKRLMAFNTKMVYNRTASAYRALLLRHKTGFMLSPGVFEFVKQVIDLETLTKVRQILSNRHGSRTMRAIMEDYDRICAFKHFDDYRRYALEVLSGEN
ncbi:MAG: hypothetical protein ACWGNK_08420 [Desulfobacterales bacterium]